MWFGRKSLVGNGPQARQRRFQAATRRVVLWLEALEERLCLDAYTFVNAGLWSNVQNWQDNGMPATQLPGPLDEAYIQAACSIPTGSYSVGGVEVDNVEGAGGSLTLGDTNNDSATLNIVGTYDPNVALAGAAQVYNTGGSPNSFTVNQGATLNTPVLIINLHFPSTWGNLAPSK